MRNAYAHSAVVSLTLPGLGPKWPKLAKGGTISA
jgi:hypothetical protein